METKDIFLSWFDQAQRGFQNQLQSGDVARKSRIKFSHANEESKLAYQAHSKILNAESQL